jgi:glucose/arabinose dehydrogenase
MSKTVSRNVVVFITLFLISPSHASADIITGLRAAFGFDEGAGLSTADQSGNQAPATLVNNPAWSAGKIGTSSLLFDKANDFLNIGAGSNLANLELQGGGGMTIAFWIRPTTLGTQALVNKGSGSAFSFALYTNPDGRLIFERKYSSTNLSVRHDNVLVTGQWQHILITWNGSPDVASVKIYKNGAQQTQTYGTAGSGTKNNDALMNMFVGAENGSYGINGAMDEVRFYNRVLTSADAAELFAYNGSTTPPPGDVTPPIRSNGAPSGLLPAGTQTTTLFLNTSESATCKYGTTANTTYTALPLTFGVTGGTSHSQSLTGLTNGTGYSYVIRCQDVAGNANTNDFIINFSVGSPQTSTDIITGLKAAFGFEEGAGLSTADQSGNQAPATLVNNPAWSSGKIGTGSLLFDKASDFLSIGAGSNLANLELQGGGGMSLGFWIRPTSLGTQLIANKGSGANYAFAIYTNADGRLVFERKYSSTNLSVRHDNVLVTGQWQHILVTWNGSPDVASVKIYKNGVQQTQTYGPAGIGTKNNDALMNMYVGAENGSYGINGAMDEVRFYNRVLTSADAVALFNYNGVSTPVDVTPPTRANGAPSGMLPAGSLTTTLSLDTDEPATCKYGTTANTNYAALPYTFGATGGTSHSQSLTGLTHGTAYSYVIRCQDAAGNANTTDFPINFTVSPPTGGGPVTFASTLLVNGLRFPTAMAFAPDGRIFVTEKDSGQVRVIRDGTILPTPFASVSVRNENERGLLGLALDPNFSANGYVYIYYTASSGSDIRNRIVKLKASSPTSDVSDGTQTTLFELQPLDSGYHNGGALLFGNDGKLYAAIGENGYENDSQNINSFRGKIIRINTDGSIPADNPTSFDGVTGTPTGVYRAVWAMGFRNPFTFAVDPVSGEIRVNDVGDGMWEEINVLSKGGNYGWPACEGSFFHGTFNTCNTPGFTNPIYAYSHVSPMRGGGSNASIAGGVFYRGNQLPPEYDGAYFFADVIDWFIDVRMPNGEIRNIFDPIAGTYPLDLDVGPDGGLYYLTHASPNNLGSVYKITAVYDGNLQPNASFAATPAFGVPPLNVSIDGSASSDPNGDSLTYEWDFGDGATQSGVNLARVNHIYTTPGRYTIALRVVDPGNLSDVETRTVSVGNSPTGVISMPAAGSRYTAGDTIAYSGSGTDPEDGALPASAFSWTIAFHHGNHTHPVLGPVNGVTSGSFNTETVHEAAIDVFYRVNLTVTDSTGLLHTSHVDVLPRISTVTLDSNVSGISFTVDGAAYTSPFQGVAGIIRTLAAPLTQTIGGSTFEFVSWSDGGTATHQISTPVANTTYTATYRLLPPSSPNLLTGLKAYFAFDESAGVLAGDSSGNQGAASVLNNPVWTTGRVGSHALLFDKANDFVNAGASANTADLEGQGSGGMSVAFWIRPTTLGSFAVVAKGAGSAYGYSIYMNPSGRLVFYRKYSSAALSVRHENIFVADQWQHIVLTWTGSPDVASVKIYRNGVPQTATSGTAGSGTKNSDSLFNLYIGAENGAYGINGAIDDARFYNRTLTPAEALELANQ